MLFVGVCCGCLLPLIGTRAFKSGEEHHALVPVGDKLFSVTCASPGAIYVATKSATLHRRHGRNSML